MCWCEKLDATRTKRERTLVDPHRLCKKSVLSRLQRILLRSLVAMATWHMYVIWISKVFNIFSSLLESEIAYRILRIHWSINMSPISCILSSQQWRHLITWFSYESREFITAIIPKMKAEGVRFSKYILAFAPPSGKKSKNLGSWPMDYTTSLGCLGSLRSSRRLSRL